MPDELEQQLAAYGRTLAAETEARPGGGPITSGRISERATRRATAVPGSGARRWAILGAAACVAALVAGLALTIGRDDDGAPAAAPDASPADPAAPGTNNVALTTTTSTTSTTTISPLPFTLAPTVPADPLGLERDGWTLVGRDTEPFSIDGIEQDCPGAAGLVAFDGAAQVHDVLTPPAGNGLDLDVTVVTTPYGSGTELAAGIMAIGDCIAADGGLDVTTGSVGDSGATWFRAGPDFALVAVVSDQVTVLLEIEGADFDDALITDLIDRTTSLLADTWPAATTIAPPAPVLVTLADPLSGTTTSTLPAATTTVPRMQIPQVAANAEQAAAILADVRAVLACSDVVTVPWPDSNVGDSPAEAFYAMLEAEAATLGPAWGQHLPWAGWTELVLSSTASAFVHETDGSATAIALVNGIVETGQWYAVESAACRSALEPELG